MTFASGEETNKDLKEKDKGKGKKCKKAKRKIWKLFFLASHSLKESKIHTLCHVRFKSANNFT